MVVTAGLLSLPLILLHQRRSTLQLSDHLDGQLSLLGDLRDEKCIISVDELPGGMVANALLR